MKTKTLIIFAASALSLAACTTDKKTYDATGTFEATEVTVAAEQTGRIMYFDITEGQKMAANTQVGLIDTVQLQLKALQMGATRETYESQKPDIQKQIAATRQQLNTAEREQRRAANLVKDGAANQNSSMMPTLLYSCSDASSKHKCHHSATARRVCRAKAAPQRYNGRRLSTNCASATSSHLSAVRYLRNMWRRATSHLSANRCLK